MSKIEPPLGVRYFYAYGEADGPFKCDFNGCEEKCWEIYTEEKLGPRNALKNGEALCGAHKPNNSEMATLTMTGIIKSIKLI